MKAKTKTYKATSKTGVTEIIRDSRDFKYGCFIVMKTDCRKCTWHCKAGVQHFGGCSSTIKAMRRKSIEFCKTPIVEKEIVELEII